MEFQEITPYKARSRWYAREDEFYVVTRTRGATTFLQCYSDRCPAHWSFKEGQAGPVIGHHDHDPTPWVPNRNSMYQALKRRAMDESISLNVIYEEEAARYPDAAPHMLYEGVVSSMRKWRRSTQPGVPHTLEGYAAALAEHPRHSDMLLGTVSAGGANAVILVMPGFRNCIRDSRTIIVDATFLTVPAGMPAYQLLTLHCVIEGCYFHPVLVLMENRRRDLYEAVLHRIWHVAGNPRPEHIVTDFEPALQAALETVTGVQVHGCLFHHVQAMLRRSRQEGINVARGSPGWRMVQLYAALATLPPNEVQPALAELLAAVDQLELPIYEAFHEYYIAQWIIRIGPDVFSVYGRPHQTSNVAESFHASLRRALGHAPNVWRFTDVAAQKFTVSASRIEALRLGRDLPRRCRQGSYLRATTVANNTKALERGLITLREYLIATSRHLEVAVGIVVDDVPDIGNEIELPAAQAVDDLEERIFDVGVEMEIHEEARAQAVQGELILDVGIEVEVQEEAPGEVVQEILRAPAIARAGAGAIPRARARAIPRAPAEVRAAAPVFPRAPVEVRAPAPVEVGAAAPVVAAEGQYCCQVCLTHVPDLLLQPCCHPLCSFCQARVEQNFCPFCRTLIIRTLPLFFP